MMRCIALVGMLSLVGCQQPAVVPNDADELRAAQTRIEQLEKENADLEAQKQSAQKPSKAAKAEPETEVAGEYDGDNAVDLAASSNLCWQDYCPCEPGQDGEGMEASLCRNLKAGIHVDDEVMAAAAMARDARRQIRDFNQQNPGY